MRTCGECDACCYTTRVDDPALSKEPFCQCQFATGDGCSTYASRPASCAGFSCAWLSGVLPIWMTPRAIGCTVEILPGGKVASASVVDAEVFRSMVDKLYDELVKLGVVVLIELVHDGRGAAYVGDQFSEMQVAGAMMTLRDMI